MSTTATGWNSLTITNGGTTLTGLTNNTDYQWRVQTDCSAAEQSDYTPTQTFRTCYNPPTSWYASVGWATSIQFAWYGGDAGSTVTIQYKPEDSIDWPTVSNLTSSPYAVSGLSVSTTYN